MSMTVSVSKGRTAILHDVRKEISANVDKDRIGDNEIFIDELKEYRHDLVAYTNAHFQPYIDEYNKGKKPSRQIQETYTEHIAKENEKLIAKAEENKRNGVKASVRKPTQLAHEYVLQFGNRENNSTLRMDGEEEKAYKERMEANKEGMREALEDLQAKYPHAHVLLATYHQDEPNGTPHMHILVQFEGEEYERGLSHQISISKALELDGLERSQNRANYAINRWTTDISDNILTPSLKKHLDQDREKLGEHRKHEDIIFFREKAKAEAEALRAERELTQDTHDKLDKEIDRKREYAEAIQEGGAYTNEQGEYAHIGYKESIKYLESTKEHLTENAFAYKNGGWYFDYDKGDGFTIPDGGIEQSVKDAEAKAEQITRGAETEAERITVEATAEADKILAQANEQLDYTKDTIQKNNGIIQGQVDQYRQNEASLNQQADRISQKQAQLDNLDKELTAKAASVERISQSFDRIAERVPEHDAPEPVIKSHKVIDQEKGFLREEVSHKEYSVSIPASSLEDAQALQREIGDLYTKHYAKEGLKGLTEASERQAREQADKMLADAQERIRQAENVLQQQQQIIAQANQQAQRTRAKAEADKTAILEQAEAERTSILGQAKEQLQSMAEVDKKLTPQELTQMLDDSTVTNLVQETMLATCQQLEERGLLGKDELGRNISAVGAFSNLNRNKIIDNMKDRVEDFIDKVKDHIQELTKDLADMVHHRTR